MSIKKVLVTGGAGYVGARLVPKLLQLGIEVIVYDWYLYGEDIFGSYKTDKLRQIKGDIRDAKLLGFAMSGADAVIHLASISNDPSFELNPLISKEINYLASKQLADLAKEEGVRRFIFASTSSVYGVKKEKEVTEDLPLEPLTDYSRYKVLAEKYLLSGKFNDMTVLIVRPATVCGYSARMRLDLTVNMLTIQALVKQQITVYGGIQKRPNIHIEDITDFYVLALSYPEDKIRDEIYNVGYQNYTVSQIARLIKKVLADKSISIKRLPTRDLRSYYISSQKVDQKLGFIPKHTVEEAILDIKRAYEQGKLPDPFCSRYYNIAMMKENLDKLKYEE